MLWIPILTTIIIGFFILCVIIYIIDCVENTKDLRWSIVVLMLLTWMIASTWVLYYN